MNQCDIRIGTCGFSYRDWKGVFYPEDLKQADYLDWYTRYFNFVEIDYTYYKLPEAATTERLCRRTGEGFLFGVKATGSITHQRDEGWTEDARRYIEGIKPFLEDGKLGAVVAQFPFSFHYTPQNRTYLARFCDALGELPLCIEFRNDEWQKERVVAGLKERGVHLIEPDLPALKGLPSSGKTVAGNLGYVRFHGRNSDTWWKGDNVSRYDYLYSEAELSQWAETILDMALGAKRLFLAFNNHHKGQAVKNAFSLQKLLNLKDVPPEQSGLKG